MHTLAYIKTQITHEKIVSLLGNMNKKSLLLQGEGKACGVELLRNEQVRDEVIPNLNIRQFELAIQTHPHVKQESLFPRIRRELWQ